MSFKAQYCKEMETELKLLRNEREQFVEMGVRLEIQTKELGLIMRDQKKDAVNQTKNKKSPRTSQKGSNGGNSVSGSSNAKGTLQLTKLKNYLAKKLSRQNKRFHSPETNMKNPNRISPTSPTHPSNMSTPANIRMSELTARNGNKVHSQNQISYPSDEKVYYTERGARSPLPVYGDT